METWFAKQTRARMAMLGMTLDKELANTLAAATGLAPSGVSAKLSKLFAGEPELLQGTECNRERRLSLGGGITVGCSARAGCGGSGYPRLLA